MKRLKKKCDSHKLVVSDDLDCHLLASSGSVPGTNYITEDPLASVTVDVVALVQRLPDVHSYKMRIWEIRYQQKVGSLVKFREKNSSSSYV